MPRIRSLLRHPALPVFLVALALAWPVLRPGYALFWGTPYFQFIPWRWLAWRQIVQGHFPWWNPYAGLGTPLFANYQTAVLYPPTWLLFLAAALAGLKGLAYAHGWVLVGHWLWAAWGMVRFLQGSHTPEDDHSGFPRLAAWLGGLVFAFSGYSVARAGVFLSMNAAMAWTPWVLWATHRLVTRPGPRAAWLWSGIVALLLLSGHAQTAWYTLLLAGLWAAWRLRGRWHRRVLGWAGFAGLAALALAAGQLAATAEYTLLSQRSQGLQDEAFALQYSFWPWHYLNFLHPRMFGHPARGDAWGYPAAWEDAVYVGVLPLLLALYAALRRGFRDRPFWLGVLLTANLFALGRFTPLYPWLYRHVPTFDAFQAPARWHLWTVFALAVLAAEAAARVSRPSGRGLYWSRLATAAALGLAGTAFLVGYLVPSPKVHTLARGLSLFGLAAFVTGWLFLRLPAGRRGRWLLFLWAALDLALNQQGWLPAAPWEVYTAAFPGPLQVLERTRPERGRFWIPPDDAQALLYQDFLDFTDFTPHRPLPLARAALLPNLNLVDRAAGVNAYDPLLPGPYHRLVQALPTWSPRARERLLERLAVTVVVRRAPSAPLGVTYTYRPAPGPVQWFPDWEWAKDDPAAWSRLEARAHTGGPDWSGVLLLSPGWGVPGVLEKACERLFQPWFPWEWADDDPAAWSRLEARVHTGGPDSAEAFEKVHAHLFKRWFSWGKGASPSRLAFPSASGAASRPGLRSTVRVAEHGAWDAVVVTPRAGALLLVHNAYPGWQVRVDGRIVPWFRAEYAFIGILLPPGEHRVQLLYRPWHLYAALALQALATLLWCAYPLLSRRKRGTSSPFV